MRLRPTEEPERTIAREAALWRQIGRQTVWGRRGLMKTGTVWLPLAVILSFAPAETLRGAWLVGLVLFTASALRTTATILANDLCDRAEDIAAGKYRWIQHLPTAGGVTIVTVLFCIGASVVAAAGAPVGAVGAYLLASLLGLAYSVPPLRVKCRGVAGLVCYSVCCAAAYALVPAAWLRPGWETLALLWTVVLLDRWTNLHFHQVTDCASDRGSGIRTYAVDVGPERARRSLRWAAGAASAWLVGTLAFIAACLPPWGIVVAAAGLLTVLAGGAYAVIMRRQPGRTSPLLKELPWPYLGLTYAVFRVAPLLLLARLTAEERTLWVLLAVAGMSLTIESWHALRYGRV